MGQTRRHLYRNSRLRDFEAHISHSGYATASPASGREEQLVSGAETMFRKPIKIMEINEINEINRVTFAHTSCLLMRPTETSLSSLISLIRRSDFFRISFRGKRLFPVVESLAELKELVARLS